MKIWIGFLMILVGIGSFFILPSIFEASEQVKPATSIVSQTDTKEDTSGSKISSFLTDMFKDQNKTDNKTTISAFVDTFKPLASGAAIFFGFILIIAGVWQGELSIFKRVPPALPVDKKPMPSSLEPQEEEASTVLQKQPKEKVVTIWDQYRKNLPSSESRKITNIEALSESINDLTKTEDNPLSLEDSYNYTQLLESHLPDTLNLYKKATCRSSNAEAVRLLHEQLEYIEDGLKTIKSNAENDLIKEMKIQSLFLKGKYNIEKKIPNQVILKPKQKKNLQNRKLLGN